VQNVSSVGSLRELVRSRDASKHRSHRLHATDGLLVRAIDSLTHAQGPTFALTLGLGGRRCGQDHAADQARKYPDADGSEARAHAKYSADRLGVSVESSCDSMVMTATDVAF
jgi:hypothetical protein